MTIYGCPIIVATVLKQNYRLSISRSLCSEAVLLGKLFLGLEPTTPIKSTRLLSRIIVKNKKQAS